MITLGELIAVCLKNSLVRLFANDHANIQVILLTEAAWMLMAD
jgi:hypothetical protein